MKDVRIVIVSWNVADLLERNLRSLAAACRGLDWECVVVDNASADASPSIVESVASGETRIKLVRSPENLGFAKACNLGASGSEARYVLFLNPDTLCPEESIAKLVKLADERPKAGILGPRLIYPDGRSQPSVRRFPAFWDQALLVLKLARLFPWLPSLKRYYAADLDPEKEQTVDQVMGACFLVRKELLDKKLGFDERYFIWMEEVDFCKTAKANGWDVVYLPQIAVVHHLGQSFAKEFQPRRQKYFLTSLKLYFEKWHPGWRAKTIKALAPLGMAAVHAVDFLRRPAGLWFVALLTVETVSFVGLYRPGLTSLACIGVGLATFWFALKKPSVALAVLLLELLTGSMGYLLQLWTWPQTVSLRIVLFIAFFVGWAINFLRNKAYASVDRWLAGSWPYFTLFALVGYAFWRGYYLGNLEFLIKDANAWIDLALVIPVLDIASRYPKEVRRTIVPAALVGLFWTAFKTFGVEYVSAHGLDGSKYVYTWIRRTGVGEITFVTGNAWRVFFQSHIYFVAAWLLGAAWLGCAEPKDRPTGRLAWWLLAASTFVIGISLSRSLWLGLAAGIVALCALAVRRGFLSKRSLAVLTSGAAGAAFIVVALMLPLPPVGLSSLGDLVSSRSDTGGAAVVSRWQLLPKMWAKIKEAPVLGSGFGSTITYESKDPRVIQTTGGTYKTYAFEWGWLDFWIKFGILGIPLMAWIVGYLAWRIWKLDEPRWLRSGAVASLVALAAVHFFTPYLDHPLGFAFLFLGEGFVASARLKAAESRE